MSTTATNHSFKPVSIEEMQRIMRELELFPRPTEWLLVSPQGQMWKGDPQTLLAVLAPHHPLLQINKDHP